MEVNTSANKHAEFEILYKDTYGFVERKAQRMLGSQDEASEVAQEVYSRAWTRWKKVIACDSPLGWLLVTTSHLCIDRLRHRMVAMKSRDHLVEVSASPAPAEIRLEANRIMALLGKERRVTQLVVIHVLLDEMTQEETAMVLGISRKTVQRHLERFRSTTSAGLVGIRDDDHA